MTRRLVPALALLACSLGVAPAPALPPVGVSVSSANVRHVGTIPVDLAGVGGQVRTVQTTEGAKRLFVVTGGGGVSVYDATVAEDPVLYAHQALPHYENEDVDFGGGILIVSGDPGFMGPAAGMFILDISALPSIGFAYRNAATANRWTAPVANGAGHTTTCVRADCSWAIVNGTSQVVIADLRNPAAPAVAGSFASAVGSTHDAQVDETGLVWIVGSGGMAAYDFSVPSAPVLVATLRNDGLGYHHNSWRPRASSWQPRSAGSDFADLPVRPGELLLITEESITPQCNGQGRFATAWVRDTDPISGGAAPVLAKLDTWESEKALAGRAPAADCSAHYFDERDGVVAIAWYQQGVRFLDVSNPRDIRQVGYFIERTADAFSAKWAGAGSNGGEILYMIDQNRGVDILRFDRAADMPTVVAPILPDPPAPAAFEPHPLWRGACRIR